MKQHKPNRQLSQKDCDAWNAKNPVGTKVRVIGDDGETRIMITKSDAYMLSGHAAVLHVVGIRGCYLLDRISVA